MRLKENKVEIEHARSEYGIEYAKRAIENAKDVVIFLDYDGTLTKIVSKPSEAKLSQRAKEIIEKLASLENTHVGVISGRKLEDVMSRVGIEGIWYAGNHGLDVIIGNIGNKRYHRYEFVDENFREILKRIAEQLEERTKGIEGIIVENKGSTIAFHYRNVEKKRVKEVKKIFMETLQPWVDAGLVNLHKGKMVLEVWPAIRWNKGLAMFMLLSECKIETEKCALFYLGDDITDEDAFKLINTRKKRGKKRDKRIKYSIPIFVGDRIKKTNARFYLKGPDEVISYLEFIFSLLNQRDNLRMKNKTNKEIGRKDIKKKRKKNGRKNVRNRKRSVRKDGAKSNIRK